MDNYFINREQSQPFEEPHDPVSAFWHLQALGLIDADGEPDAIWNVQNLQNLENVRETTVAIIDNGCALDHPNLPSNRIINPIDFSHFMRGTTYRPEGGVFDPFANIEQCFAGIGINNLDFLTRFDISDDLAQTLADIQAGGKPHNFEQNQEAEVPPQPQNQPQSPSARFAAHGTACAGLVGGRLPDDTNPNALEYVGVNPAAKIVPICTVYSHEYWPMIMALIYAVCQKAETILIPRAMDNMQKPEVYIAHNDVEGDNIPVEDPRYTKYLTDSARYQEKKLFEKLLSKISKKVPVVVAAGNTGGTALAYPARLVLGGAGELIVAGSHTQLLRKASYSTTQGDDTDADNGVTVYAPSADGQAITADHFRYDAYKWRGRQLTLGDGENDYSPYGVLTLDIPGKYGYGTEDGDLMDYYASGVSDAVIANRGAAENQPVSLYTMFGGTSAACSIVAGVVSLLQTNSETAMDGEAVKQMLRDTAVTDDATLAHRRVNAKAALQSMA